MVSFHQLSVFAALLILVSAAPPYQQDRSRNEPTLPKSNTSLPAPDGLKLKAIILGVGTQNYTCNSTSGTYSSNVALAQLYDATKYLSRHKDQISKLSKQRLQQYKEKGACADESDYHPRLREVGEHFFEPTTPATPAFDLYELDLFLEAKKAAGVPAPNTASDVDWLKLVDTEKGNSDGLKAVYRVETAGGRPPASCSGSEKTFVPYVAQYWFYN